MRLRLLIAAALLASACAPALGGRPFDKGGEREAPLRWKQIFATHCNGCHPGGNGGLGPALDRPVTHALLKMQVRRGYGQMPAFDEETLDDQDFEALVQYLRALRAARLASR